MLTTDEPPTSSSSSSFAAASTTLHCQPPLPSPPPPLSSFAAYNKLLVSSGAAARWLPQLPVLLNGASGGGWASAAPLPAAAAAGGGGGNACTSCSAFRQQRMARGVVATPPAAAAAASCCLSRGSSTQEATAVRCEQPRQFDYDVFLGGSCGPTVWRSELVIPYLKKRAISYYDPQRPHWSQHLIEEEAVAKENSRLYLFVLDPITVNATSFLEIAHFAARRSQALVVVFLKAGNTGAWGEGALRADLPDRLHACELLSAILRRHSVPMLTSINDALQLIDRRIIGAKPWREALGLPAQQLTYLKVKFHEVFERIRAQSARLWTLAGPASGSVADCRGTQQGAMARRRWLPALILLLFVELGLLLFMLALGAFAGGFGVGGVWAAPTVFAAAASTKNVGGVFFLALVPWVALNYVIVLGIFIRHKYKKYWRNRQKKANATTVTFDTGDCGDDTTTKTTTIRMSGGRDRMSALQMCAPPPPLPVAICALASCASPAMQHAGASMLRDEKRKRRKRSTLQPTSSASTSLLLQCDDAAGARATSNDDDDGNSSSNERLADDECCWRATVATTTTTNAAVAVRGGSANGDECSGEVLVPSSLAAAAASSPFAELARGGHDLLFCCSSGRSELAELARRVGPELSRHGLAAIGAQLLAADGHTVAVPKLQPSASVLYHIPSSDTFISGLIEVAYLIGYCNWDVTVCVPSETDLMARLDQPQQQQNDAPPHRQPPPSLSTMLAIEQRNECYRMAYLYLRDLAQRRCCRVFTRLDEAVKHVVSCRH